MKLLSKLSLVVSSVLCLTTAVDATEQITVWEDLQKGKGIEQAALDFEKETGVKVNIVEMRYTLQLEKIRLEIGRAHV